MKGESMKRRGFLIVVVFLAGFVFGQPARAQVPYSEGGWYRSSVGSPVLAPDGETFYASITAHVPGEGRGGSRIVRFDMDGRELSHDLPRLPQGASPDGSWIAFTGFHGGREGLWLYSTESGEYRFAADVPRSNHFLGHRSNKNFTWSPDSRFVAFVAAEEEPAPRETDIRVYSRILYKTRTSFTDNVRTHIFIASAEGGLVRQLTEGRYDDHSVDWHPVDNRVAFISNRTADPDDNHNNEVWTVDAVTGGIVQLTDTPGTESAPTWSPDGRYLAYLAGVRPINTKDSQAENAQVYVVPSGGGEPLNLTGKLDRRVRTYRWSPDGRYIYFTADNHGGRLLYRVPSSGGEVEQLVDGPIRVGGFAISTKAGRVAYTQSSVTDPGELWVMTLDGRQHQQITHHQDAFKENVVMSIPETFWFESFDGTMVQGWLMRPNPFDSSRKYPVILTIHGGPHGAYGYSITGTNQLYAEAGFGVLSINPRGSTGYGQRFADGTINNWGGGDYQDLMAGVDFATANNDWIDADRLGVIGGSYGGYMTNWVITQTDRFKAAVSVASVSNLISFYGTSLYQLLIETEFPGEIWDNYDLLWHWSPLKHVKNVKTPTLFIHGESDHDVPITQAEEMFTAIRKVGVESTFVRYPGEGHGFRRPDHVRDYARRRMEWFTRYLEPDRVVHRQVHSGR